jgi:hypothetical protein
VLDCKGRAVKGRGLYPTQAPWSGPLHDFVPLTPDSKLGLRWQTCPGRCLRTEVWDPSKRGGGGGGGGRGPHPTRPPPLGRCHHHHRMDDFAPIAEHREELTEAWKQRVRLHFIYAARHI